MSRDILRASSTGNRPRIAPPPRFRVCINVAHVWRILIVSLLMSSYVLVCWSQSVPHVSAATSAKAQAAAKAPPAHITPILHPAHPVVPFTRHQKAFSAFPNVSSSAPYNGLGQLPFYTFVKHPITSTSCTCGKKELLVNVANGNLLVHTVEMHIQGTGVNLDIESYYNSLAGNTRDLGWNWNFSLGHDVGLDVSNPSVGITFHGPSGYYAYFAANGSGGYTDAPGLNATLTKNSNGTYTLSFHKTGEKLLFGTNNHLSAIKDKNNNTLSIAYDSDDDVTSITDTQNRVISFTHNTAFGVGHDPEGQVTKIADPTGRNSTYSYSSGELTSSTNLDGKTTSFGYNPSNHDLVQITDSKGNVTKIAYDSSHRVTSITDPLTGVMQFTYNSGSTVLTDQRLHNTTYNYDATGKVISVVNDNGITVSNITYNTTPNNYDVLTDTDAMNNTMTFGYDPNNNLNSVADGSGAKSSATYTNTTFPYYPSTATDAQGSGSSYSYDSNGNINGNTNTSMSPTVSVSESYNSDGTVHTSTDANGYVTSYGYTSGNLTSVTPPSPQHGQTRGYDALSRVTSATDGNGTQISYTYTNLDRISTISYKDSSGGNASSISYTYDDDGNVTSVVDSSAGTTSYSYDALNRQTKKTLPDSSTITYGYDATNNLTSLTDAGGTVSYGYNNLNELTSLTQPKGTGTETFSFTYDDKGERVSVVYPTNSQGTKTVLSYDHGGRVAEVNTFGQVSGQYNTETDYKYSYTNSAGTVTSLRYSVSSYLNGASWTTSYSYDALNRLTGAATTGGYTMTSAYKYDANGNRLTGSTLAGSGTSIANPYNYTYSYDTANQLKQVNASTCSNDGNGNQTGCGTTFKESYNPRNQTTSMSGTGGTLSDQYVGSDSTQRVQTSGSRAATYTYNALGLGTEKDSSGNLIAYTRDNQGNVLSMRTTSGNYYYLFDGLGSVVALMPSTAVGVVNSYVYDPYGVTQQQTGTQYNPWQFASGYFDASTLYYKYGTRYYDRFGRWTQQDPMASANRYLYADDDPVNETDPSGRDPAPFCAAALGGIVVGILGDVQAIQFTAGLVAGLLAFAGSTTSTGLAVTAALAATGLGAVVVIGSILFILGLVYAVYYYCRNQ